MNRAFPRIPVIIDCDPGCDDLVALALAVRSPELDVRAIATSYGTAPLTATTRNTETLLAALACDVQIRPGSARPLTRDPAFAAQAHGATGAGDAPVPPASDVVSNPTVLLDLLAAAGTPVTLVTLGPLTNLAHAVAADRALVISRVTRHLGMFGTLARDATPEGRADFNAWTDPEAADRVLNARLDTTMVTYDVTSRMILTTREIAALAESPEGPVRWLAAALRHYAAFHRRVRGIDGCALHDTVPIGALLAPGAMMAEERHVTIDLDEGSGRGHTREHSRGRRVGVSTSVDVPALRMLLRRVLPIKDDA